MANAPFKLADYPIALQLGGKATIQERFTGELSWYDGFLERTRNDGVEARLVSLHTFTSPWDAWEMHPEGDELVVCVEGSLDLLQEVNGEQVRVTLNKGDAVVNPPGTWHTADVEHSATALFVTAGLGTQHRPR